MEVITFGPDMEMPEIIAGVLKRIRDDIDKFVDNKTKDYENI